LCGHNGLPPVNSPRDRRLDNFKPVNDLYGHRLGDEVLRVVAARLSELAGKDGTVARLRGDEFGVLLRCGRGSE
jgi:diguanylate cyclase (GGDEF)-like protein